MREAQSFLIVVGRLFFFRISLDRAVCWSCSRKCLQRQLHLCVNLSYEPKKKLLILTAAQ